MELASFLCVSRGPGPPTQILPSDYQKWPYERGPMGLFKRRYAVYLLLLSASIVAVAAGIVIPNLKHFQDKTGAVATFYTAGNIKESTAFFQSLGTNGRSCATCHQPDQAFSLSAKGAREVYERTQGHDPLFAAVDGANCPTSTSMSRAAHSMLLERGLFRLSIAMPVHPEFTIAVVHDPYGCAITY